MKDKITKNIRKKIFVKNKKRWQEQNKLQENKQLQLEKLQENK
jgi:hypothetical protein